MSPSGGSGQSSESGAPDWVVRGPETAEQVRQFMRGRDPPGWDVSYLRGDSEGTVRARDVRAEFGNDRAEIEMLDGRIVTVNIPREMVALAEVRE